ncbi:Asp-tRNA(Asn)/Glu-tRNA(Gln) amidotransferase subunit GatB [Candidatus Kaiserbacteria bacterium]|nr:Asp-tRNA(Asn)/Glu-tRNA(Gln) amidotransferase subunit GatB [Candidatus Kaiserbacteria bacterium]
MAAGEYRATIGMEIHAELRTATKMFCRSKNDPDETRANVNVCPVCMAHPGTLPVINQEAVKHVLRVGLALGSKLADYSEFDRKNYFYPDLPKGYQISQYEFPLVTGGTLNGVAITRVHLEEDTASSIHDEKTGATLIDYNRAGVPLMELVTEPVIHSAAEAGAFARELQLLLRYLGVSHANMEKGEMRVEANISVSKTDAFGTKVEVKNLNSFRAMERAVEYEIKRQISVLESGGRVEQQTLGWDENKQATFPQRIKEGSADYRYFPDPDLPSLKISEIPAFTSEALASSLPELPWQRRQRYVSLGIKTDDADAYVRTPHLGDFFEQIVEGYASGDQKIVLASNYIANDLVKIIRDSEILDSVSKDKMPISAANFRKIIDMAGSGKISSRSAKDLIAICAKADVDAEKVAEEKGMLKGSVSEEQINEVVRSVLAENANVIEEYRSGKVSVLEYLVGQCMKKLRGAGDPPMLREAIKSIIGS